MSNNEPSRTVSYLNSTFRKAIESLRMTTDTPIDQIKEYEIDFAYIIDEIERGPEHFVIKKTADANKLIREIEDLAGVGSSQEG